MGLTRQQRRRRARELAGLGEAAARRGLPRTPKFDDLLGLALLLHRALAGSSGASPTACAEIAHKTFEVSARTDRDAAPLACRKGCAYCCYAAVMVTAPEAFHLARAVRTGKAASFLARAAATAGMTAAERFGRKLPCPLLKDNLCTVYAARPLSCRRVTSFAVEPCREEYEGLGGDILLPRAPVAHAGNAQIPLLAALKASGHPPRLYELAAAVTLVLDTENAEARWLAGEDIFAGIGACEEPPRELTSLIDRLAGEVRAVEGD
ncbi:MAG TPA: YkgJ family cysteine cluster protein [Hyphomicrobiaceae bacterium]|nr:YkgJ family cysteine cluster protein [Hyphomicrobiaceae bacterium]